MYKSHSTSSPVTTVLTAIVAGWFLLATGAIVVEAVNPGAFAPAGEQLAARDAGRKPA